MLTHRQTLYHVVRCRSGGQWRRLGDIVQGNGNNDFLGQPDTQAKILNREVDIYIPESESLLEKSNHHRLGRADAKDQTLNRSDIIIIIIKVVKVAAMFVVIGDGGGGGS